MIAIAGLILGACASTGPGRPTAPTGTGQIEVGGVHAAGVGGKFAGLIRTGELTSVAADWRVPSIARGSEPGRAATWIGAQSLTPANDSQPFIQIGTREELRSPASPGARGVLFYETFWTDPEHGLHPISLFQVRAGDAISAQMSLHHHQVWWLTITDSTSGQHRLVTTRDEGTDDFSLALWLQEDPTATATNRATPYPDLSAVHMTALKVNGAVPATPTLQSTWMNLPHAYLGPTRIAADGFTVLPQQLSAAGLRYLKLGDSVNAGVNRFLAAAAKWRSGGVPAAQVATATNRLIAGLAAGLAQLRARAWPPAVAGLVRRLAATYASQITALRHAEPLGSAAVLAALPQGAGAEAHVALSAAIRAGLGLPRTSY